MKAVRQRAPDAERNEAACSARDHHNFALRLSSNRAGRGPILARVVPLGLPIFKGENSLILHVHHAMHANIDRQHDHGMQFCDPASALCLSGGDHLYSNCILFKFDTKNEIWRYQRSPARSG